MISTSQCGESEGKRKEASVMRKVSIAAAVLFGALLLIVAATPVPMAAAAELMPFEPDSIGPGTFESPGSCTCHGDQLKQWSTSMHANAWTDPVYRLMLDRATADIGELAQSYCVGCHAPAGLATGSIDEAGRDPATNGITCTFCHYTTGITADPPANLSLGFPQGGPDGVRRAQIMDPRAPHPAEGSSFFDSAELCGACHNVNHPTNGLELEMTYTEWSNSPQAAQGITCQNCHMHREVGGSAPYTAMAAAGAPERDNIFAMTFVGANVAQGDAELNTALLKSAATIDIDLPDIIAPGGSAEGVVTVTNVGAGHSIPTGLTEVRRMWLEVYAELQDGTQVELANTEFRTIVRDAEGNEGGTDFWNAVEKVSDVRIKAGESYTEPIEVIMPEGAEAYTVKAVLRYKSTDDEMAAEAGVENPTTDMASAQAVVFGSQEAKDAAPEDGAEDSTLDPLLIAGLVAAVLVAGGATMWLVRRKR